jgi:hypothetical protein
MRSRHASRFPKTGLDWLVGMSHGRLPGLIRRSVLNPGSMSALACHYVTPNRDEMGHARPVVVSAENWRLLLTVYKAGATVL